MKKVGLIFFGIIVLIGVAITYIKIALPDVGEPENIQVEFTDERFERGYYLANSVAVCMDCHSERDWNLYAGPLVEGTLGQGGERFGEEMGFPGNYFAKNITPAGIGDWTDGELLRAITTGVSKNGNALFPVMPYHNYGRLAKEDILSIIVYLRSLDPIENKVPEANSNFPMNLILNTIPNKAEFSEIPDKSNKVEYGKYLFTAASCNDCHTQQVDGQPVEGMEFAGGFEFPLPTGGIVRSANITPHAETGIGSWDEEDFIMRFKTYADSTYEISAVDKNTFNTVMPWMMYSTMHEEDIAAIFSYLKTIKAIENEVVLFSPDK